jgi:hypothetical protein
MTDREDRVLFGYCPADASGDGVPNLVFMMPEAAWAYMSTGMCHEFDMTHVGIPMRVIIGRCRDHAEGMRLLSMASDGKFKDLRDVDMKLDQKPPKQ